MNEIKFYKAGCGDAAKIRYKGDDGRIHNVFIDGGYERTFRSVLADEIRSIELAGEEIDLWVVSHIHDDHIGGVVSYIKAIRVGEFKDIVREWLFNFPRIPLHVGTATTVSQAMSIGQGDALTAYLLSTGKLYSTEITSSLPVFDLWGMKISVLSPDKTVLTHLREKYPSGSTNSLERIENDIISEATGRSQSDYHIKLEDLTLIIGRKIFPLKMEVVFHY